jgi:hypothetical protein
MEFPQALQGFSGATAIGGLVFVDLILIGNAFADNLFPAIRQYSENPTWAIVVAVPLVSLAYLLGVLSIGASELILTSLRLLNKRVLVDDTIDASSGGEYVAGRFQQIRQEAELLGGGVIAFALLALGAALSGWRIEGWRRFLTAVAVMAVVFGICSAFLCIYRYRIAHDQAVAAKADRQPI